MAFICFCGEKVKHAWSHKECAIKHTVEHDKNTMLYKIVKRNDPDLVEKFEKELSIVKE